MARKEKKSDRKQLEGLILEEIVKLQKEFKDRDENFLNKLKLRKPKKSEE